MRRNPRPTLHHRHRLAHARTPLSLLYLCRCCFFRCLPPLQVTVESAGDEASDAAAVEEKLLSLRKGQAKLRVVADRGLQVGGGALSEPVSHVDCAVQSCGRASRQG